MIRNIDHSCDIDVFRAHTMQCSLRVLGVYDRYWTKVLSSATRRVVVGRNVNDEDECNVRTVRATQCRPQFIHTYTHNLATVCT